jgi:hypothetical protein
MKRKRGNPNWGKSDIYSAADIQPSSFEQIVQKLRLSPEQYLGSIQLKEWGAEEQGSKVRAVRLVEGLELRSYKRPLKNTW